MATETGQQDTNIWDNIPEGVEVTGRIYRVTTALESVGRPGREFIGKVYELIDEEYIATNYGAGRYNVHYRMTVDGKRYERDNTYNIGKEYAATKEVGTSCRETAAPAPSAPAAVPAFDLGGMIGGLTVEKVAAIGAAFKAIKDIFAPPPPPPPQIDVTKLLEIIAANNRPAPISDAVLIQAMQSLQKQNAQPSLLQQVRELKEVKEALTDETAGDSDGEGGNMNFLLEQAFKYLPALLTAKQNNFQAVGQEVKNNPMVAGLIRNNPDLATAFINRAAATYGEENARQLAAGFGLQLTPAAPQQAAPQQPLNQGEDLENDGEG